MFQVSDFAFQVSGISDFQISDFAFQFFNDSVTKVAENLINTVISERKL